LSSTGKLTSTTSSLLAKAQVSHSSSIRAVQVQPQVSGQQPGQGSEHGAVSPVRPQTSDLTPQHRDLVPQDKDLRVLGGITPGQERQPSVRANDR
jgi:hypothetical protein